MKRWLVKKSLVFFEKKRNFFLSWVGMLLLTASKSFMKVDLKIAENNVNTLTIDIGRMELLIDVLRRRVNLE